MALLKFGPAVKTFGLGYVENEVGDLDDKLTLKVMRPDPNDEKKLIATDVNAVEFLIDQGYAFQLKANDKKAYDAWAKDPKTKTNDAFIVGQ